MKELEYSYWEVNYISCEGNKRWTIIRCPIEWGDWEVETAFRNICYGVGDEPAEFISCELSYDDDYTYDFDESNI